MMYREKKSNEGNALDKGTPSPLSKLSWSLMNWTRSFSNAKDMVSWKVLVGTQTLLLISNMQTIPYFTLKPKLVRHGFWNWYSMHLNFFQVYEYIFIRSPLSSRVKDLNSYVITGILDCSIQEFPFTYLGLPIKLGTLRREDWANLFELIEKK